MKLAICTIATATTLPQARILLNTAIDFIPSADRYLLLAERSDLKNSVRSEQKETLLMPDEINLPSWETLAFGLSPMEFISLLKPVLLSYLLKEKDYDGVIYFDAETKIYFSLESIINWLSLHQAVLTPHLLQVSCESKEMRWQRMQFQYGAFDTSFLAFSKCKESITFLSWWATTLSQAGGFTFSNPAQPDAYWANIIPSVLNSVKIIRHASYNLTYGNSFERSLCLVESKWQTYDGPLYVFHFRDPLEGLRTPLDLPNIALFIREYEEEISKVKPWLTPPPLFNSFGRYEDGTNILLEDRKKYFLLHPLQKKTITNPFMAKDQIKDIRRSAALLSRDTEYEVEIQDLLTELKTAKEANLFLLETPSWKIGRFLTFPIRFIRNKVKALNFRRLLRYKMFNWS